MRGFDIVRGEWKAFNKVLNYLNTLETKVVKKKDIYEAVMDMRPNFDDIEIEKEGLMHAKPKTETHLEISVWNIVEGDHVKKFWDATWADYDALIEQYEDEPFYDVVIDRKWEQEIDEET